METGGMKYDCDEKELLRAVCYGTVALFAILAALDFTMVAVGLRGDTDLRPMPVCLASAAGGCCFVKVCLRTDCHTLSVLIPAGGPLETRRRAAIRPLLALKAATWVAFLCYTGQCLPLSLVALAHA